MKPYFWQRQNINVHLDPEPAAAQADQDNSSDDENSENEDLLQVDNFVQNNIAQRLHLNTNEDATLLVDLYRTACGGQTPLNMSVLVAV